MKPGYVRTFTGKHFNVLSPIPSQVDPKDIAHQLSLECRWGGATRRHYSVAEHSMWVARFARCLVPAELKDLAAAWGLLHDAHEAYVKDVPTPIKVLLSERYLQLCAGLDVAIKARFSMPNLPPVIVAAVHAADHHAAWCEAEALLTAINGVTVAGDPPPQELLRLVPMRSDVRRTVIPEVAEQGWASLLDFHLKAAGCT